MQNRSVWLQHAAVAPCSLSWQHNHAIYRPEYKTNLRFNVVGSHYFCLLLQCLANLRPVPEPLMSLGKNPEFHNVRMCMSCLRYILNTFFHMRCLRCIPNVANEEVLKQVRLVMNRAEGLNITWEQFRVQKELLGNNYKTMKLVGDLILDRQTKLWGHIMRRDQTDLMRKVTLDENLRKPCQLYKRTGQPRLNWTDDNLQRAFRKVQDTHLFFDPSNTEHREIMINAANNYLL